MIFLSLIDFFLDIKDQIKLSKDYPEIIKTPEIGQLRQHWTFFVLKKVTFVKKKPTFGAKTKPSHFVQKKKNQNPTCCARKPKLEEKAPTNSSPPCITKIVHKRGCQKQHFQNIVIFGA